MDLMRVLSFLLSALLIISRAAADEVSYNDEGSAGDEIQLRVRRAVGTSNASNSSTLTTTTPRPQPTTRPIPTKLYKEKHQYYHVTYLMDNEVAAAYKRVFDLMPRTYKKHAALSSASRRGLQITLSFNFLFYGHEDVNKVTVATGGFLYLSNYLHKYLTFSQYIAPLMADFDTSIGSGDIAYADTGTAFFARWEKVHLKDQQELGNFTFEAILHKNGTIIFVYEHIPVPLSKINSAAHSLKLGVSDAYYRDEDIPNSNYFTRRIIRYHAVALSQTFVATNVVIILHPLPTCVQQKSCSNCISAKIDFKCNWCSKVSRCSSGIDRLKQNWEQHACHKVKELKKCPHPPMDPGLAFLIFVVVLIIVGSIVGLVVWIWYAYKYPTSRSGMFLMEHRPSVLAAKFSNWRRGGGTNQQASDIYRVDSSTA